VRGVTNRRQPGLMFIGTFARNLMAPEQHGPDSTQSESSAPQRLERLVRQAENAGASDIHLQMTGSSAQVSFRLDGVMAPAAVVAGEAAERLFGRIKFLARLKTYQDSLPQDGRIDHADIGSRNDVRVSTYPTVTGEKIVLRLFQGSAARTIAELGLPERAEAELERLLKQNAGLLLLTGPAGSGKTTTIHACLAWLAAQGGRHVITVEDPVEQIIPGVMQTEVNEARGLTFAVAARHLLRQDPQVLVVGEIRDEETASIAVRAALTGHLMISTLHAGSCAGVWERLTVMCPDHSAALSALELILNQRLIRRVCGACAGSGCGDCLGTGYKGRAPVVEWFRVDDSARRQIRERGSAAIQLSRTLETAARQLVERGITDERELERTFAR
jgi:type II secretory ATPase GspE/PulE/Tfp pilus assembly ATPase PilB-like protein